MEGATGEPARLPSRLARDARLRSRAATYRANEAALDASDAGLAAESTLSRVQRRAVVTVRSGAAVVSAARFDPAPLRLDVRSNLHEPTLQALALEGRSL